jgi:hypothetical protein
MENKRKHFSQDAHRIALKLLLVEAQANDSQTSGFNG